jgi:hypothetical protein
MSTTINNTKRENDRLEYYDNFDNNEFKDKRGMYSSMGVNLL